VAPDDYQPYNLLAINYKEAARYEESIEPLKKAISLHTHHVLYYSLGESYSALGRYDEAIEALKKSVRNKTRVRAGSLRLGHRVRGKGRHPKLCRSSNESWSLSRGTSPQI
jgi:tetratricopeptide (TPR) repeat protein